MDASATELKVSTMAEAVLWKRGAPDRTELSSPQIQLQPVAPNQFPW